MSEAGGGDGAQGALRASEERFRNLFENSPISIWEEDFSEVRRLLDGLRTAGVRDLEAHLREHPEEVQRCAGAVRIVDVNRAAIALHRAASKADLLAGLLGTFTPESFETFRKELLALWDGKTELVSDAVVRTLAGERRHVAVHFRVSPGHERALSSVLVSLVDVTEQKKADDAIRQAELRYRQVFENSSDVIYLLEVTDDGRFRNLDVNPAFERSVGLTAAQVLGKCQEETVPAETARIVNAKYRACVEAGKAVQEEVVLDLPTGRKTYRSTLIPIRDGRGRVYRIVGLSRDATDQVRAEAEVRELNQDLERRVKERTAQLQAAKDEIEAFAYTVSHDLRAPLRHIDGFVDLLKRHAAGGLGAQAQHDLAEIEASARRMGVLIDDLLSFSRMGHWDLAAQEVDLGALVAEAIREVEAVAPGRAVRWTVAEFPKVTGDRAMLRLVLVNLLANAMKFTRPRPRAEIEVGVQPGAGGETVLFVRDNGVGFDMRYVGKLFGVFQRLHRPEEFEGTGIGLASVRRIIARHGGRVWAEGELEGGATFYFSLPAHGGPPPGEAPGNGR